MAHAPDERVRDVKIVLNLDQLLKIVATGNRKRLRKPVRKMNRAVLVGEEHGTGKVEQAGVLKAGEHPRELVPSMRFDRVSQEQQGRADLLHALHDCGLGQLCLGLEFALQAQFRDLSVACEFHLHEGDQAQYHHQANDDEDARSAVEDA